MGHEERAGWARAGRQLEPRAVTVLRQPRHVHLPDLGRLRRVPLAHCSRHQSKSPCEEVSGAVGVVRRLLHHPVAPVLVEALALVSYRPCGLARLVVMAVDTSVAVGSVAAVVAMMAMALGALVLVERHVVGRVGLTAVAQGALILIGCLAAQLAHLLHHASVRLFERHRLLQSLRSRVKLLQRQGRVGSDSVLSHLASLLIGLRLAVARR